MTLRVTVVGAGTIGGTLAPIAEPVLDALTRLWFTLALARGRGRNLAFRMLP